MICYEVTGKGPEYGVSEVGGGMIYDLLPLQDAVDICIVLNAGIGPEWDAVEPALKRLITVKEIYA